MRHIELEGKQYLLKGRFGQVTKILKKYNILNLIDGGWGDDDQIYNDFVLESTWKLIQPKRFFKPYFCFSRFKKRVIFSELMYGQKAILSILYGQTEEQYNKIIEDEQEEKKTLKSA